MRVGIEDEGHRGAAADGADRELTPDERREMERATLLLQDEIRALLASPAFIPASRAAREAAASAG